MDALRLRYLHAMQIPVWVERSAPVAAALAKGPVGLKVGPGNGAVMLVCEDADHTATSLAADLSRAIGNAPAWAWPDANCDTALEETVNERLLTGVAVLGQGLAQCLFEGKPPSLLGTARLVVLPAMQELLADPQARRRCWSLLCEAGLVARS
jgi:hypothetical protein